MTKPLPRVVVFGEALTDFLQTAPGVWASRVGGACWNVARAVAALGVPAAFAGAVSEDDLGDELAEATLAIGLDPRFLQRAAKPPFLALVPSQHPPRYFFAGGDSADLAFDAERLPAGWLEAAEVVHFGSISLARAPLASRLLAIARAARAAGKRITFDPNWRNLMDDAYRATFEDMIRLASDVKVSDEDLARLLPDCSTEAALATLLEWNPTLRILYTEGAQGLRLLTAQQATHQPAVKVTVADTVGAGDASLAGWIVATLDEPATADALPFAAATAAAACMRAGAHPPSRAEVDALLSRREAPHASPHPDLAL
ncbi:carbohydrate kinase family protein [Pseudogulbenkiania ferrooxidans]|uniref:PfkB domain protein n=1 Tax=Pseudogulbenkiania ferrooxidans 2002 TaxID=279714 RepID=B9Z761_9NEIS|nr:carbohydrate kinase [Pseudogulbenkiania ferrooxidans]EEG07376.1 PfkB domain protein [Pseudogulbenkiania ferrooxidans 2002]